MSLPAGKWFSPSEFACRDATRTPYPEDWADRWATLVALCDAVRELWGTPLEVVSGYRTVEHNEELAKNSAAHQVASSSQHTEGRAADLRPIGGGDASMLYRIIMGAVERGELPALGGVGLYPASNWVHVDCRAKPADGHVARWFGT